MKDMAEQHPDLQTLSAYLDGELAGPEHSGTATHIESCPACAADLGGLQKAARAVSSLPAESPDAAEHRALRQAILGARPKKRWTMAWQWLAGAAAVSAVVAGFSVFIFTQREPPPSRGETAGLKARVPSFRSEEQVRRSVESDPAVVQALAAADPEGGRGGAGALPPQAATAPGQEAADSAAGQLAEPGATSDRASPSSGGACLAKVAQAQTRAVTAILFRRVEYKNRDAWMLVYSLPSSGPPGGRVQIEIWIMPVTSCADLNGEALLSRALLYSFLPANQ